ncbi:hypothetical protein [Brumimicrobium aurantiacum]|uniref:Glycosyltransferase family 2 protein n=1 Tax=Brumimicrobium aurantiacum TaxID=1737063 RepID=A0A3E1F1P0_9FLAO|nr:hypothetical protein [Brumimicrobium aurantiacum]RFC55742.1 hypothetical protein DXU93_02055 [Brumimicrobium aurantiacum]
MKSLITITSCNRLPEVQKYIWDYLKFVNSNESFHFVLALDGNDQTYIDFCEEYNIPLIYSEEREGVGLSKNRVLTQFPDYGYYFFIEDDVELINSEVFQDSIRIHERIGAPHLCYPHGCKPHNQTDIDSLSVDWFLFGGAQFASYTRQGIHKVGGFNTLFAKYKRYGHTEHSYRFFHQDLQPSPFIFPSDAQTYFLVHDPPSVTIKKVNNAKFSPNGIIMDEQEMIDQKTTYFPLETLSKFYFNDKFLGYNKVVAQFLKDNPQQYPLSTSKARKKAFGEYYALKINKTQNSHFKNLFLAFKSMLYAPMNNELKHKVKYYLKK